MSAKKEKSPEIVPMALSDADLAKFLGGNQQTVDLLKQHGAPRNVDGTWNVMRVFGFMAADVRRKKTAE